MKISTFFTTVLGANLANVRWSWGAVRPDTNRVFLRVWEDELESIRGVDCVYVLNSNWTGSDRAGGKERARHIDLIRNGAEGYGVVCRTGFDKEGKRFISDFDSQLLLRLGRLLESRGKIFAQIDARVPLAELASASTNASTIGPDLKAILASKVDATTKQCLVDARIGQGQFRANVLAQWGGKCCVTRSETTNALRASHIKAWRESDNQERLDPHNGLPLVATLDALFDAGLISFEDSGTMIVSGQLTQVERELLGLQRGSMSRKPSSGTLVYLKWHREKILRS